MSNPYAHQALLEACAKRGCPLCRVTQQAVRRFLEGFFYEKVNDWGLREQLRMSKGFCNAHAWLILESSIGNALGVAIVYKDIMADLLKELPSAPGSSTQRGWLSKLVERTPPQVSEKVQAGVKALIPQAPCPACEELNRSIYLYSSELIGSAEDEAFSAAFASSEGLCLPHLGQTLGLVEDEETFDWLLAVNRKKLESISAELAEFVRKSDHRYIKAGYGEEGDVWRRILTAASGAHPLGRMD